MSENQPEQTPVKDCPILKSPCSHEKCQWWVELAVMKPGATLPEKQGVCVLIGLFMVLAAPRPQPQVVKMPMPPGMMPPGFNPLKG